MGLVDDFPKDPFTPSLPYAAAAQLPVTIPWGGRFLPMGTPLVVGSQPQDTRFLDGRCAFSSESLKKTPLAFRSASRGMEAETSTQTAAARQEHTSVSLQAQIGGSVIGMSGRANYEARAAANQNACFFPTPSPTTLNASFRTEYQTGWIGFVSPPRLSPLALELLNTRPDPHTAFRSQFGDYYVGAYLLGGANAQLVSSNAIVVSSSKDLSGKVEMRFMGLKAEKKIEEHERSEAAASQIQLTAYDSLEAWDFDAGSGDVGTLELVARENQGRCRTLVHRVAGKVESFQLQNGATVSWERCEDIYRAHLVAQILLLPYAKLREYALAILAAGQTNAELGPEVAC
ncbi:unnamed protein product [Penicillium glandicola]